MCGVCGCGQTESGHHGHRHGHSDHGPHNHKQEHSDHEHHGHEHEHSGHQHDEHGHEHSEPGRHLDAHVDHEGAERPPTLEGATATREARLVRVERDLLEKNNRLAAANRLRFRATKTHAVNLVSSPGAGKTTLLVRTLREMRERVPLAVIEGDQQTALDADRIRATGAPAHQINTGKLCHLDAQMIDEALTHMAPPVSGILFIENIGNLVCPAGFDLGEGSRVALVSVTEGEDKPLKYPDIFRTAALVLVTKMDLLPHLDFELPLLETNVRKTNPKATVLRVSARTGDGMSEWYAWLGARRTEPCA
jgi:hydrogenase nickel incorporation protein HypB